MLIAISFSSGEKVLKKFITIIKNLPANMFRVFFTESNFKTSYLDRLDFDKFIKKNLKKQLQRKQFLPGISAVIRVKNGEEFLESSVLSILTLVTEIIIVDNGSSDDTFKICQKLKSKYSKFCDIKIFQYNNKLEIAGNGYLDRLKNNPDGSLAKFYNYCFSLASCEYVMKWDAHCIIFSKGIKWIQNSLIKEPDYINIRGVEFYGKYLSGERSIYKKALEITYKDGEKYEYSDFGKIKNKKRIRIKKPIFLHIKRISYSAYLDDTSDDIITAKYKS